MKDEDMDSIWGSMPTLKPNISRIILAWHRQKTDVVLSNESAENVAPTPASSAAQGAKPTSTTTTLASTFSTTAESGPITVSLDLSALSPADSSSPAAASGSKLAATTPRPVDLKPATTRSSSHGDAILSTTPITTTTTDKSPKAASIKATSSARPSSRRPTSSSAPASSLAPTSSSMPPPEQLEEWINQIHGPTTPRPYVAERDCGLRPMSLARREGRVVGGRDSQLGEFPWSVLVRETTLLGFFVKTKCGGALIDLKWVLTAAHCKPGMFGSLEVVVGETDLSGRSGSGGAKQHGQPTPKLRPVVRRVKRMIVHRDYNPSNFDNDIALLELESPYQLQPHVVPFCLPEKEESFIGQEATVAGWGKLSFGGPVPSVLQVARLPVMGNKQCQEMYHQSGHIKLISDSFLCAGYATGGQDSCEGDSGGPLQVQRPTDGRWVLAGTVSHGIKCAEPNLPGIYIRIAAYLPWIKAVTYQQDHNKRYGYRRQFSRMGSVQLLR